MNLIPEQLRRAGRSVVSRIRGRAVAAAYRAASIVITRIKNWVPNNRDSNSLIFADGEMLRARSRSLVRESTWAAGAIDTFGANCVGTGIKPLSQHPSAATRKTLEENFEIWTDDADAAGTVDFYGLQKLVCRAVCQDGEIFVRFRFRRPEDKLHVPLQIQVLEADHCPYWQNDSSPTDYTRAGIKFDLLGRRLSYFLYRDHPGSEFIRDATLYEIPAAQIMHIYEVLRPGQLRGQPFLTPAIIMLYDIGQYLEAALLREKIANLLSFFIKKGPAGGKVLNETEGTDGNAITGLTPGSTHYLNEGEEVQQSTPPGPGAGFTDFVGGMLRAVSRALRLTYEQLTGDMTGVNYSSARVALLEFRRWMEAYQHQVIVFQFCRLVWRAWCDQAAIAGIIDAKDYAKNRKDYLNVRWQPQGWPWVDPEVEAAAAKTAVRSGFTSRRAVVAWMGESVESVDAEQSADNQRIDDYGNVTYDSDGRNADRGVGRSKLGTATQQDNAPAELVPAGPAPAGKPNGKGALTTV